MIIKEIEGNVLDSGMNIAHGVNCQNVMGSGVAKAIYKKYPEVKSRYHEYFKYSDYIIDTKKRLGTVQPVQTKDNIIFNLFTQEYYGRDGKVYVDYDAIRSCFKTLNYHYDGKLAIPRIGSGLAGGDWNIIKDIINEETPDIDIYVYYLSWRTK